MSQPTDDLRIREIKTVSTPAQVISEAPGDVRTDTTVSTARHALHSLLDGSDDRLAVVIGPCSIHDPDAALEYAGLLRLQRDRLGEDLEIVMRVYFEKPRTTVGWKGLINDPDLDGSFRIDKGLRLARGLLRDINRAGVPAGCEFLDMITPQYLADLVAWGAIGARTTESQVHRELASGLSCPVGFKNGTDGNIRIAAEAVLAAAQAHHFMAVTKDGRTAIATTTGNRDCHVILRGGHAPNHDAGSVDATCAMLVGAGLVERVMIDASHANSGKNADNQPLVVADVASRIEQGDARIFGLMIESHLLGGRQDLVPGRALQRGQSITDACIDWRTSVQVLDRLALAARKRRQSRGVASAA